MMYLRNAWAVAAACAGHLHNNGPRHLPRKQARHNNNNNIHQLYGSEVTHINDLAMLQRIQYIISGAAKIKVEVKSAGTGINRIRDTLTLGNSNG